MKAEDRLQEIIKSGEINSLDAAKQEGFIKGWNEALRIHIVVGQSEQLICPHCNKYKRLQGNSIIHQLCECGE